MTVSRSTVEDLLRDQAWRGLTADRHKLETFAGDRHFAPGLACADRSLTSLVGSLQRHALLVIQPDCVARRLAERCIDFVTHHGFVPVHAVRLRLDPVMVGALWAYQSSSSTQDSLDLADILCAKADSLLVLLRDGVAAPAMPASLRLTQLKGPADPAKRTAGQLRTLLGAPNKLVVYVHAPDEPVDMVRELAVMRGPAAAELYRAMEAPVPGDIGGRLTESIAGLYRDAESHDMDPAAAVRRLAARCAAAADGAGRADAANRLLATLRRVREGPGTMAWQPFARDLRAIGIDPSGWDPIVVASEHITHDLPGTVRPGGSVAEPGWSAVDGVLRAAPEVT